MHQIERIGSKRLITTAMHVACCNISVHIVINRLLFHRRNITCNKSYTPLLVIAPAAVGRVSSSFRSQRFADINEIIHLSVRVCVSTIYLSAFPLPSVLFSAVRRPFPGAVGQCYSHGWRPTAVPVAVGGRCGRARHPARTVRNNVVIWRRFVRPASERAAPTTRLRPASDATRRDASATAAPRRAAQYISSRIHQLPFSPFAVATNGKKWRRRV